MESTSQIINVSNDSKRNLFGCISQRATSPVSMTSESIENQDAALINISFNNSELNEAWKFYVQLVNETPKIMHELIEYLRQLDANFSGENREIVIFAYLNAHPDLKYIIDEYEIWHEILELSTENHNLTYYFEELMDFLSESPMEIKQDLLDHVKERLDYFDNNDDNDFEFDNVARVERKGTLFEQEHQEFVILHNIELGIYANSISDPPIYTPGMTVKDLDETMCPQIPLCTNNWNEMLPNLKEIGSYQIEDAIEPNLWRNERFWLATATIVICPTSYDPVADDSEDLYDTESFDQYLLNGSQSLCEEPDLHEEINTKSKSMHIFPLSYENRTAFSMATKSGTSTIDECKSIQQLSSSSNIESSKMETSQHVEIVNKDIEIHGQLSSVHPSMDKLCEELATGTRKQKKPSLGYRIKKSVAGLFCGCFGMCSDKSAKGELGESSASRSHFYMEL